MLNPYFKITFMHLEDTLSIQSNLTFQATLCRIMGLKCLVWISGASGQNWGVTLTHESVCAVPGALVSIPCTFTHPPGFIVTKVYWITQGSNLAQNPQYVGRVQYGRDMERDCTLTLSDVRVTDTGFYYIRLETNKVATWQSSEFNLTVRGKLTTFCPTQTRSLLNLFDF